MSRGAITTNEYLKKVDERLNAYATVDDKRAYLRGALKSGEIYMQARQAGKTELQRLQQQLVERYKKLKEK